MILEKIKKINEQFIKIDETIEKAQQAKARIDEQIEALREQQLVLKGKYQAYSQIGQELGEFTVDENGVITPIYQEQEDINEPIMKDFEMESEGDFEEISQELEL